MPLLSRFAPRWYTRFRRGGERSSSEQTGASVFPAFANSRLSVQPWEDTQSGDVLWEVDRHGRLCQGRSHMAAWLDVSVAETRDLSLLALLQARRMETPQRGHEDALSAAMAAGVAFRDVPLCVQVQGRQRWWSLSARPLRDERGALLGWRGVLSDVTVLPVHELQLPHLVHHDSLTGIANRVLLRERLEQLLSHQGAPRRHGALLCLDLDRFRSINDTLGHSSGDDMLRLLAQRLLSVVRRCDLVARLGSDEFAVLLDDMRNTDEVKLLVKRLMKAVAEPGEVHGRLLQCTASMGVALVPADGDSVDALLGHADLALSAAKEQGRGRCEYFAPWMAERSHRQTLLERELRHALARGELSLAWQPWVDLQTWTVVSAEALVRWVHPVLGEVAPSEFIPIAERSGLIGTIGAWVLKRACHEAVAVLGTLPVSVNVSPVQMMQGRLLEDVRLALLQSGLPSGRLEIEITEGVLLKDTPEALSSLHQLKSLGVSVALDDFGTGYSSLAYLRRFSFDTLKIDRAFVRELLGHADARAIVRTIVELARMLGMRTVAEGVEEAAQLDILQAAGCGAVQGHFLSRPLAVGHLRHMIERWSERWKVEGHAVPWRAVLPQSL